MKTKKIYIILFTLILVAGCKKQHRYPDDPKSTFDKPKTRLIGAWQLNDYIFNGNSILNTYNFGYDITSFMIKDDYDGTSKKYTYSLINPFENDEYISFGPFSNSANCSYIKTFLTPLKCSGGGQITNWTITKLYDKDLHLKLQTDTGEFKMFFKKIHK